MPQNIPAQRSTDGHTRKQILTALLHSGPVTASQLADAVAVTPAGVRRHLDKLLGDDLVEHLESAPAGKPARGRPAKRYRLTTKGRESFGNGYDELALAAFAEVEEIGGRTAVKNLARKRAERLLAGVREARAGDHSVDGENRGEEGADKRVTTATHRVADAFAAHGYAAEANHVGSSLQLCQHHCPVHAVAAQYPEICEAEHELISELVGSAVAPLALIANGDGVCTSHISLALSSDHAGGTQMERSGDDD